MPGERPQNSILAPAKVCQYLYNILLGFMGDVSFKTLYLSFIFYFQPSAGNIYTEKGDDLAKYETQQTVRL